MNTKIISISISIAILFVGAIVGTMSYYNGEIANLNSQISILKNQPPHLVTALGITEIAAEFGLGGIPPYNHLWISGALRQN